MAASDNITTPTNKRRGHRSHATKLINILNDLIKAKSNDADSIKKKEKDLNETKCKIAELDKDVQTHLDGKKLTDDLQKAIEYEQLIGTALSKASDHIKQLEYAAERGIHRTSATKLINKLNDLIKAKSDDVDSIKKKEKDLNETKRKIAELDKDVQTHLDGKKLTDDLQKAKEYEQLIDTTLSDASEYIKQLEDAASQRSVSNQSKDSNQSQNNINQNQSYNRNFDVPLPSFDGDVSKFSSFWHHFESAIHDNAELNNVTKLSLLKSTLKGSVAQFLDGFITDEEKTYQYAVDLLKLTFGQRHFVVDEHILGLLNLKTFKDTYREMLSFHGCIECHLQSLDSLKIDMNNDSVSTILATIIVNKLPSTIMANIVRQRPNENWSLKTFRELFGNELERLQREDATLNEIGNELARMKIKDEF